ncbi:hypothetical protein HYU20_02685 [Candidatus Woesearchaeota archaeon]|nr:hypothetical protein [Candidatus Woesearchaeota archaeon]
MVAQEQQGAGAERKANWREKAGFGLFASLIGAAGLYFLLGGVGYLVTSNNYARLNPPIAIEGKVVRYEERQPVKGFWRYFPFVDRDGKGITNVTTP